jgi:hypothetical protein
LRVDSKLLEQAAVLLCVDLSPLSQESAQQLARLFVVTTELAKQVQDLRSVKQSRA